MFQTIRAHLADNRGDENISKMIWVAIVFVVGAIMLIMISSAFKGPIKDWFEGVVTNWFAKGSTGQMPEIDGDAFDVSGGE